MIILAINGYDVEIERDQNGSINLDIKYPCGEVKEAIEADNGNVIDIFRFIEDFTIRSPKNHCQNPYCTDY